MTDVCVDGTTRFSGPGTPHDKPRGAVQYPQFREALRFWFKLGWISFGGTAAHIGIMHDELVHKKRWISNRKFLHALSHCMVLPGPEAQQLAIYIGWKLHGKRGGIVAGTLFVLPSMFVLLTSTSTKSCNVSHSALQQSPIPVTFLARARSYMRAHKREE